MRRLAEQRTDKIIDSSPNGIVIVDGALNIIKMNSSFQQLFRCSDNSLGQRISTLVDPEPFEKLLTGSTDIVSEKAYHSNYDFLCHQIVYALREDNQFVGIFVNLSEFKDYDAQIARLKSQTVQQAQELVEHQIKTAQTIAKFLGESTAHTESLVNKLVTLVDKNSDK